MIWVGVTAPNSERRRWGAPLLQIYAISLNPNTSHIALRFAYLARSTFLKEEITMLIALWIQHLFIIKRQSQEEIKKNVKPI